MLVSLDQVNTLAKSRYKNYMITIQSVNSMMMEEIANSAGTTDDVDFLHTSAKDVDTIEQYFTFIAVKVIDVEVEKVMLELRLTLAKEDKINNKIKGKDKLVSVCKQLSEPLAKKAEELCKTKFYKNSHFEVGSRIAFIDELQIYNSNFINYLVFVLDNLNIILRENLGINLRIAALAKEDTHCPFDKNINNVLNGLLKCTTVKIVPAFNGIESEINKLTEIKQDTGSFYALAKEGANNNYVIIDEKQIDINGDQDNLIGPGLAKFLDIKLSNSTMSAYCRFTTESKIYNRMLVTLEGEEIKFHPFYFGVPKGDKNSGVRDGEEINKMDFFSPDNLNKIENRFLGVTFVGTKTINSQTYDIYYAKMMQLYTKINIINSFVNKATSMHVKWTNAIAALKFFIATQHEALAKENKTPEWAGGSSSYKSTYGVYFKSSKKFFKQSEITNLYNAVVSCINDKGSIDAVCTYMENSFYSKDELTIIYLFLNLYKQSVIPTELLSLAYGQKYLIEKKDLLMTLYLYEIRVNAYKSKLSFKSINDDPLAPTILEGSDENSYTLVNNLYGL